MIDSLGRKHRSAVTGYLFREKQCGWLHPTVRITFANRTTLCEPTADNHFNLGFHKKMYLRPACYKCPFKYGAPLADITLGDFWELLKYQPSLIHRAGTSAVLVHTERGRRAVDRCAGRLSLTECPYAYLETDSSLRRSPRMPPERTAFFADLERLSFDELTRKYIKPRGALWRQLARLRRTFLKYLGTRGSP